MNCFAGAGFCRMLRLTLIVKLRRLVSVFEIAPEFAANMPEEEWAVERDSDRIAQMMKPGRSHGTSGGPRSKRSYGVHKRSLGELSWHRV
jgi:hypothetical protein